MQSGHIGSLMGTLDKASLGGHGPPSLLTLASTTFSKRDSRHFQPPSEHRQISHFTDEVVSTGKLGGLRQNLRTRRNPIWGQASDSSFLSFDPLGMLPSGAVVTIWELENVECLAQYFSSLPLSGQQQHR